MHDQKNTPPDPRRYTAAAVLSGELRGTVKKPEGKSNTTGAQPGMTQHNEQGKPADRSAHRTEEAGPNPGPGITSQGHRVDEDTPVHGDEQDPDRKQTNTKQDMPSSEKPRDRDKDRKDPLDEHKSGDKMPEEAHQHKH